MENKPQAPVALKWQIYTSVLDNCVKFTTIYNWSAGRKLCRLMSWYRVGREIPSRRAALALFQPVRVRAWRISWVGREEIFGCGPAAGVSPDG